ncbi:ATP-grasp domain-containing protein [Nonomuraea sp. NPDC050556]|uniref:ATP-grasp domain-containing protein n=1 Tax=Nonomuraea sp. NPDC050556 TaxID=3364369 RepID=UPI0037BC96A2
MIVVLGGSDGTISTFRAARRLGIGTICVDMRADAPGVREADEFLHLSTRDVPALADALHTRGGLTGVIAPGTDINLPSLYELADLLGLPCPLSEPALHASTDKAYFRALCARLGLPGPRYDDQDPAFPVIVKPVDSGSSRGITICSTAEEVPAAVEHAALVSPTGRVIVEEVVTGLDLCAEAFLQDGRIVLLGLSERVTAPPGVVAIGHDMSPREDAEVVRQLELVCAELGYRDGPLNADLFLSGGQVVLIEIGARIGGNGLGEALGLMYGVDTVEAAVLLAIGERPRLDPKPPRHVAVRVLRSPSEGTLTGIRGLAEVVALPEVADVVVAAVPGDHVVPYTECRAKLGYVLASAESAEALAGALAEVDRLVQVDV